MEVRRNELKNLLLNEEFKWSRMKSPLELDKALTRHRIEMVLPGMRQVVRLRQSDLPPSAESMVEAPQYASLERVPMNE
ncbi:MAG: hypothetical protein A2269_03675 [Lentisphaerae bacterium RIFOXYA12_FULL_60_10]|nr:MAG: hypothetical protein A2269_03675 [Lentisphaerae bacterium RIFOXYA12_FULL_60_10]